MTVDSLFDCPVLKLSKPDLSNESKSKSIKSKEPKILNEEEKLERTNRTIFVGNIPISISKRKLASLFKQYGKVELIWERSIPVEKTPALSIKVKVILKKFSKSAVNKNAYVVYKTIEEAKSAVKSLNKFELEGRHLHVTMAGNVDKDFKTTIFIGNLNYKSDEEEIRKYFEDCGTVEYVRLVRDSKTQRPKGFCYLKFSEKSSVIKAIEKNGLDFNGRPIRVFKARKAMAKHQNQEKEDKSQSTRNNKNKRLQK